MAEGLSFTLGLDTGPLEQDARRVESVFSKLSKLETSPSSGSSQAAGSSAGDERDLRGTAEFIRGQLNLLE